MVMVLALPITDDGGYNSCVILGGFSSTFFFFFPLVTRVFDVLRNTGVHGSQTCIIYILFVVAVAVAGRVWWGGSFLFFHPILFPFFSFWPYGHFHYHWPLVGGALTAYILLSAHLVFSTLASMCLAPGNRVCAAYSTAVLSRLVYRRREGGYRIMGMPSGMRVVPSASNMVYSSARRKWVRWTSICTFLLGRQLKPR